MAEILIDLISFIPQQISQSFKFSIINSLWGILAKDVINKDTDQHEINPHIASGTIREKSLLHDKLVELRQSSIKANGKENSGSKKILPMLPTLVENSETSLSELPSSNRMSVKKIMNSQTKLNIQRDKFVKVKNEKAELHYTIVKKLGEGSYGSVYKVFCKKTKEERAMKIIKKADVTDEENVFSELEVLKKLDHPSILKLYEIFQQDEFFYVITEYCQGGQVLKSLKKQKLFTEKNVADIMRQLLGALVYMHDRNIVHRDLKLQNLMYEYRKEKDGKESPIKVIDFGTSRLVHPNIALHAKMGSPFYVAPEVLNRNYNIKCDIWSCGVIMYILLSGHPPFYGKTPEQIFEKIKKQPVLFEDEVWDSISDEAISLIRQMLNRNVASRPTASALLGSSWIQNCVNNNEIDERILFNLENFYFRDRFRAVVLTYLASTTISKQQRRALACKFNEIDKDRSGVIQRQELLQAYKQIYKVVDEQLVQRVLAVIDTNGSGKIDFTEFMVATYEKQKLMRNECLVQAFDFFDADSTGYLDIHELKQMLGQADDEQLKRVMKEIDTNLDNKISKDEFIRMIKCPDE